jgi:hypothetical protein
VTSDELAAFPYRFSAQTELATNFRRWSRQCLVARRDRRDEAVIRLRLRQDRFPILVLALDPDSDESKRVIDLLVGEGGQNGTG